MAESTQGQIEQLTERLVDLQIRFTHLERTMADLDQMILSQAKRLEALERTLASLGSELRTISGSIVEERKPEDEKPPHY
jgi:uncharacterized coiled-coil protein SlyX